MSVWKGLPRDQPPEGLLERLSERTWLVCSFFLIITLPSLLINLDVHPFINDEAIRATVAMEMIFSGDYLTPTLAGELYLNKPPVYNWFICLFYKLSGSYGEFTVRLVAVVSLFVYLVIIFSLLRPRYGNRVALISSLMFLTCGRILFYDSFHGLIDIAFSALVYLSLISIYYFYRRRFYWLLFLVSYALTGVTFLMKGLPSVYFQGASLLVWFIYRKESRKLLSIAHFSGIMLFIIIVGSYYWFYAERNPGVLSDILNALLSESTRKTALGVGMLKTIRHIVTFPFEFIYHFLPWTVMVIYFIRKKTWQYIREDEFLVYNLLLLAANVLIFWLSADTYGRYLFLHASFLFPVLLLVHFQNQVEDSLFYRLVRISFLAAAFLLLMLTLAFPVSGQTNFVPLPWPVSILVAAGMAFFILIFWNKHRLQVLSFAAALLIFRMGFDWFILPSREKTSYNSRCRDRAIEIGSSYEPRQLYIYQDTEVPAQTLYYISREWRQPLGHSSERVPDRYYIVYEPGISTKIPGREYLKVEDFPSVLYHRTLSIIRFAD